MAGLYETFDTDQKKEREGVWVDYGDFRVKIARAGGANVDFTKVIEVKTRPYRRAIATNTIDKKTLQALVREAFADTIVRDWQTKIDGEWQEGIESHEGGLIPFNATNVLATYTRLPNLFEEHQELATEMKLFRQVEREEGAKNSLGVSSTS